MAEDSVFEQSNLEYKPLQSKSSAEQSTIKHKTMEAVKNFAEKFANGRRFKALKISNLVLLLAIAILSTICGLPQLRLDNWSDKVRGWRSRALKIGPEDHWNAIPFAIWAMFVLATFSLGMYCYGKKTVEKSKIFLSCLAITDICFSLFFLVNLLIVLAHFLSQATSEYIWFYPSLVNGAPLENLTGFESWGHTSTQKTPYHRYNYRDYHRNRHVIECDYGNFTDCENKLNILRQNANRTTTRPTTTTTPRPTTTSYYNSPEYKLGEMAKRKRQILARLALDPTVAILAALAILVNIVYMFCIRKAMKQSNMRPNNYEELHPHCSEMDSTYAKFFPFGLLKIVHWVIPAFLFHANLYRISDADDHGKLLMACWFGISFCHWISYVKKIRFPSDNYGAASGSNRSLLIKDFVVYGIGLIFYSAACFDVYTWSGHFVRRVSLGAIFLLICSIFANVHLMFKYCGCSKFCQKFDQISINVSINVTKDDNQDSESAVKKTSENSVSDGQEKEKDHNEKKTEKGLHYIDV
ncbi:hypothetical protein Ddc_22279 [Ditylenchus destructor]|nr:hypothetical protein Ddc_22279 [Ditylenchus destructor]